MKVLTGKQMKEFDAEAIKNYSLPSLILMENAGRAVVQALLERVQDLGVFHMVVVAGRGNNGGDGLCAARHLLNLGASVEAFLVGSPGKLSEETSVQAKILEGFGLEIRYLNEESDLAELEEALSRADVVIDALLGIGVRGPVRGLLRPVIERINASDTFVVAVDVPSGVDADTGAVAGAAVKADLTVTLEYPKLGLLLYPGRGHAGEIVVSKIGYPELLRQTFRSGLEWVDESYVRARLPQRRAYSHKGDYGKVFILAGSRGLTGAAIMAAEAALRSGAGLVYLGYPESLSPAVEARLLEAVKLPLPERAGALAEGALEPILNFIAEMDIDVMAVGPGLSRIKSVGALLRKLLPKVEVPLVIDADGLNALASPQGLRVLKGLKVPAVLTPHPGELSRLIGRKISEIEAGRVGTARETAESLDVILVLKGVPTVTALPSGEIFINSTGNSGLATGGSGDVLTGLIAGLIAQGMPPEEAAPAGVYLHGLLADRLKGELGERAMIPGDLIRAMPQVLREFE